MLSLHVIRPFQHARLLVRQFYRHRDYVGHMLGLNVAVMAILVRGKTLRRTLLVD